MSDNEDDDDEEEEEEEDEEEGGEEEEEEEEKRKAFEKKTSEDISLILDVFSYVDRTSKRIASRLDVELHLGRQGKKTTVGLKKGGGVGVSVAALTSAAEGDELEEGECTGGGDDGGWSNYEHYSDAQRAQLLERAIMVLGSNDHLDEVRPAAKKDNRRK